MTLRQILSVKKAAVLGAGVMGAQIAAHLMNANIETLLFDMPASEGDANALVNKAIQRLEKLSPSPVALPGSSRYLRPANYAQDLEQLKDCDLIIEAIAEKFELKQSLYQKIAPYIQETAVLASNTSGLSINHLADSLPASLQARFLGIHFFNPPRYMRLVEVIPGEKTDKRLLPALETFLVATLGKGVVYAKDTPNFIANRVGVFSILAIIHHAEQYGLSFEIIDALTGPVIGRPKSATFRTMDVVGLDTFAHVIKTMTDHLQDDPWHAYYQNPDWLTRLIEQGRLGQKNGAGIYKKIGRDIHVYDLKLNDYRMADQQPDQEVLALLNIKDPQEKFIALRNSPHPQAQFLWAVFRDLFHYCAYHLQTIAESVRDVDLALRWGFGWKQGAFETWQLAGWQRIADCLSEEIQQRKTMAFVELPAWVKTQQAVYTDNQAYAPARAEFSPRFSLAVYKRQLYPEALPGEHFHPGHTLFENESLRAWHQGDDIAILSFKTKMNTVDNQVLDGIRASIHIAEKDCRGLIIWQHGNDFSAGANLKLLMAAVNKQGPEAAAAIIKNFQETALALRYCQIPTVAALRGRALGGGCELAMHCDKAVAALETYIGLVEIGVGLLPAGGGTKELALRAATRDSARQDLNKLSEYYQRIARAQVSGSAVDAIQKNILRPGDSVILNADEILYVAKQQIMAMSETAYRPPRKLLFPVAGKSGMAALKSLLANYREGGFISDYDYFLAGKIAEVMCGGEVEEGTEVTEEWILRLERDVFVELLQQEKTQQRITHILETGKPLRN